MGDGGYSEDYRDELNKKCTRICQNTDLGLTNISIWVLSTVSFITFMTCHHMLTNKTIATLFFILQST